MDEAAANPLAVEEVDCVTLLRPPILAAVNCDLDCIYELMRCHPLSISIVY